MRVRESSFCTPRAKKKKKKKKSVSLLRVSDGFFFLIFFLYFRGCRPFAPPFFFLNCLWQENVASLERRTTLGKSSFFFRTEL